MTTEDDFQHALDANPADWQTRIVFADWLQERGDERAEGYRALGVLRLEPYMYTADSLRLKIRYWWHWDVDDEWYMLLDLWRSGAINKFPSVLSRSWWNGARSEWSTRRGAEDAAALAFFDLRPDQRAKILSFA